MGSSSIKPDINITWNSLLSGHLIQGSYENVLLHIYIFESLQSAGFKPDSCSVTSAIKAIIQLGYSMRSQIKEYTPNAKISCFSQNENYRNALQFNVPDINRVCWNIDDSEKETELLNTKSRVIFLLGHIEYVLRQAFVNLSLDITSQLMKIENGVPIRVVKDTRICHNCLTAAKYIPLALSRDILLRWWLFSPFYERELSLQRSLAKNSQIRWSLKAPSAHGSKDTSLSCQPHDQLVECC
ncbi:hypothetical protein VNO77_18640 [Canavalia gladiata]|uniref:DYW domain-containing protein n=1 Tax=Canavalia gladiata TaxID=3824 RepID=A0AAN9QNV9_CANGL